MLEKNNILLNRLSIYLNNNSNHINKTMIDNMLNENLTKEEAYSLLLFYSLGFEIDKDKEIYNNYFRSNMVKLLDINKYVNNLYYKNIKIDNIKENNWSYELKKYDSYELFVYNDLLKLNDGRLIPQLGFFDKEYYYPCVKQDNREWMLITPNEIETMESVISDSYGNVLTYGLGLGYFPYMVSLKENVFSITIIEKDIEVINMFKKYILPQFEYKDKIKIINCDAFDYEKNHKEKYDFVFVDIWHDPSDGIDLYLKFKKLEREGITYNYWIEKTIKCYISE